MAHDYRSCISHSGRYRPLGLAGQAQSVLAVDEDLHQGHRVGGERFELTAGMSLLAPRQIAHRFSRMTPEQQQDHELTARMFVEYDMEVLGPPLAY